MVHANEFSYGLLTPGLAFAMSCVGSFLGLRCAGRARACVGAARAGWLLLAAASIGATGIWVMHNIALLGFSVPGQAIRYDVPMSLLSGLVAVAVVLAALVIAGSGGAGLPRLLLGGIVIGGGVLYSMDFVGMAAMRMPDTIAYNAWGVVLSVLIAVAAATLSLWAAMRQRGIRPAVAASVAMGVAISGMHYTAMAAMRFTAAPGAAGMTGGVTAAQFALPLIVVISVLTFILIISVALGRTEEQIRAEAALNGLLTHERLGQAWETSAASAEGRRAGAHRSVLAPKAKPAKRPCGRRMRCSETSSLASRRTRCSTHSPTCRRPGWRDEIHVVPGRLTI